MKVFVLSLVLTLWHQASGHGRLMEPPSRASAWRVGFPTPRNYDDNALFCGGFATKQNSGGKCGVCGDPWNGVRENEAGGKFATGVITRTYQMGQIITVKADITANHWGWFEFRICPNNDVKKPVTHACLNRNLLEQANGNGTRYMLPSHDSQMYTVQLKLPANMVCTQCVLQWKYHGGNSWGVDKGSGRGCVGCGPQEEFYGCADVAIKAGDQRPIDPVPRITDPPATQPPVRTFPPVVQPVRTDPPFVEPPRTDPPFVQPVRTFPPVVQPVRTDPPFVEPPQTNPPVIVDPIRTFPPVVRTFPPVVHTNPPVVHTNPPRRTGCIAINVWAGNPDLDKWCTNHCATGQCPPLACDCSGQAVTERKTTMSPTPKPTTTTSTTTTTTTTTTPRPTPRPTPAPTQPPTPAPTQPPITAAPVTVAPVTVAPHQGHSTVVCKGINNWAGSDYLDRWCADACGRGNCPADSCLCTKVAIIDKTTTTTTAAPPTTPARTRTPLPTQPAIKTIKVCRAIGVYQGFDSFDQWCTHQCNNGLPCPITTCACVVTSLVPLGSVTTTQPPTTTAGSCSAKQTLTSDFWNQWCQGQCKRGICPVDVCNCM